MDADTRCYFLEAGAGTGALWSPVAVCNGMNFRDATNVDVDDDGAGTKGWDGRVSGDRLVTATTGATDPDAADDPTISDVRGGDTETLAISPDGSLISAVMVADNGLTVWSQQFGQPDRIQRGSVPEGVDTVQLATADDRTVVVAGLRSATEAAIAVACPDGELVERWQIEQRRSVFRHDR